VPKPYALTASQSESAIMTARRPELGKTAARSLASARVRSTIAGLARGTGSSAMSDQHAPLHGVLQ